MTRREITAKVGSNEWQNQMLMAIHDEQTSTNERLTAHIERKDIHRAPPCKYFLWMVVLWITSLVSLCGGLVVAFWDLIKTKVAI